MKKRVIYSYLPNDWFKWDMVAMDGILDSIATNGLKLTKQDAKLLFVENVKQIKVTVEEI